MSDLVVAAASAAACGLAGFAMPRVIEKLPEPEPEVHPDLDPGVDPGVELGVAERARREEPPKQLYAVLAARGGLGGTLAYFSLVAGALIGWRVGADWLLLLLLPLVPVGVSLAFIDLQTRLLPAVLVRGSLVAAIGFGLVAWPLTGSPDDLLRGLAGMAAEWLFFAVLWFSYPVGMGYGDVRLSALLGFVLGYVGLAEYVVGFYSPFLLFGLPGLAVAVARRDLRLLKVAHPFGPFLLAGAVLGVAWGSPIVDGLVH